MIEVRDLTVEYPLKRGSLRAVDGVSLDILPGQTLAVVGESGCGKTTLGRAILRLVPSSRGVVRFGGVDLTTLPRTALRRQRRHMQMIFQQPAASLDPRWTIAQIIGEPIGSFGLADRTATPGRVREMMDTVGLSHRLLHRYPHELSGGQQQRVAIARALAADPAFIVADEPLSALDVSIQAQIINLLRTLQRERQIAYLFISHDLRAVRHVAHHVAVMYLGAIVEIAETATLYRRPLMPYTQALLASVTRPECPRPLLLAGDIPSPANPPSGCRFHPRCPHAIAVCREVVPPLIEIAPGHRVACLRVTPGHSEIPHQDFTDVSERRPAVYVE